MYSDGNTLPLDRIRHEPDWIIIISDGNKSTPDGINRRNRKIIDKIPPMKKLKASINGDLLGDQFNTLKSQHVFLNFDFGWTIFTQVISVN